MTMLNPTRKIQLANAFYALLCTVLQRRLRSHLRRVLRYNRRGNLFTLQVRINQLIPSPPAGAGTASSLTIPIKIEDRAIRADVSPNSLPPPVNVFRQSVQPNLFRNILPRWIRLLSSLAVLLRSILPSHTAGSSIIEAFQTPHRRFSQHPSLTPIQ
eukprot:scaffold5049_cov115-Skeletonema_marinoi.AAC.1